MTEIRKYRVVGIKLVAQVECERRDGGFVAKPSVTRIAQLERVGEKAPPGVIEMECGENWEVGQEVDVTFSVGALGVDGRSLPR